MDHPEGWLFPSPRFLFQFATTAAFQTRVGIREAPVRGEAYLTLGKPSFTGLDVTLGPVSLVSAGLGAGEGGEHTGKLSLRGFAGAAVAKAHGMGAWRLEIDFRAAVYYQAVGRRLGHVRREDAFLPRLEDFSGRFLAELRIGGGELSLSVSFQLRYREGGLGWIRSFTVSKSQVPALSLQPLPSAVCPLEHAASPRRIKVRPIGFRSDDPDDGPPTGSSAGRQIEDARTIWKKCCIEVIPLEPLFLLRPDLMKSDNPELVAGETADTDDPQVVEVFFVRNPLTPFDGGATVAAGTNSAKVVLSEDDQGQGKANLLAHELGHVLSGLHPGGGSTIHFWSGQQGTVLQPPSSAFPKIPGKNTLANCLSAYNPVVITDPVGCCMKPDST